MRSRKWGIAQRFVSQERSHRMMAMPQGKKTASPPLSRMKATWRDIAKGMGWGEGEAHKKLSKQVTK